ncbi:hypothetical protein EG68_02639 [Paragonimus skrjabini miyazakii]|uniref:TGF-beta family profile domain-containing protein n=1 Tax=Paragonimus skrjabini miyazakii TaxID=59628 RepID=A0A8S9YYC7_9TREM|nr:hypothetical protein EG68_02639 [Paragonimus skrjabini miyazakii]
MYSLGCAMESLETFKLSLTPSLVTFSIHAVNYNLPQLATAVESESETKRVWTADLWRLVWRFCAVVNPTATQPVQKSFWNVPECSPSSHWVVQSSQVVVTKLPLDCLSDRHHDCILQPTQSNNRVSWFTTTYCLQNVCADTLPVSNKQFPFNCIKDTNQICSTQISLRRRFISVIKSIVTLNRTRPLDPSSHVLAGKNESSIATPFTFSTKTIQKISLPVPRPRRTCKTLCLLLFHWSLLFWCIGAYHVDNANQSNTENKHTFSTSTSSSTSSVLYSDLVIPLWNRLEQADLANRNGHPTSRSAIQSETEFKQHTPKYMYRLHARHMRDWQDFSQYEESHVKHPLYSSGQSDPFTTFSSVNGDRLGTVTAIRHHKHIETVENILDDLSSTLGRIDLSALPDISKHRTREHRLFFRLAEMPENEQLLAASIRLRYVPTHPTNTSLSTDGPPQTWCNISFEHHQWPIIVWLHYDGRRQRSPDLDVRTIGSFEPDSTKCGHSSQIENTTLLYLPSGWFNIPLSQPVLEVLQRVNQDKRVEADRYIAISVRSLTSKLHLDRTETDVLKWTRSKSSDEFESNWIHEAPHLITYHRDPLLVEQVKRRRRSVDNPQQALTTNSLPSSSTPTTKVQNRSTFVKRYRKLQQLLRTGLHLSGQKRRARRRAFYPRRQSRDSHSQWEDNSSPQSTSNYRYYKSAPVGAGQKSGGRHKVSNTGFRENDASRTDPRYTYDDDDDDLEESKDNSINYLDNHCQRRELIIDFAAVGWAGWVIAPRSYNARYCSGHCPFPLSAYYNTTNHAVLLQLVHLLDAARVPGPCCVPNELSSQSLLYQNQNGDVALSVYQDMVVESCACR